MIVFHAVAFFPVVILTLADTDLGEETLFRDTSPLRPILHITNKIVPRFSSYPGLV